MSNRQTKKHTILHFCCDDTALMLRAQRLSRLGYRVLKSSNGFEAIELVGREPVDAVVLELDRNHREVTVVAQEIKRSRPRVPTIVLTDTPAHSHDVHELADVLLPREDDPELAKSLKKLLSPPGLDAAI